MPDTPGLLLRDGNPVPDVVVWHTTNFTSDACFEPPENETRTDVNGGFFLEGERSWAFVKLFLPGPADGLVMWTTCFKTRSAVIGWRLYSAGPTHPPERIRQMICTLEHDPPLRCNGGEIVGRD